MTDMLIEVKGVNTVTTALTVPHNPLIEQQVRRFGFEYEMLPGSGDDDSEDDDVEYHMDDYSAWDEDHELCNCEDCLDERCREERRRFIESLADRPQSGLAYQLMERAHANNLITDVSKHPYHCRCSTCRHTREHPLMTAQSDCSCGIEFVSRIIDLDNFDQAAHDMGEWVTMMNHWKADGLWMPDGHAANGNHVHVSADGDTQSWTGAIRPEAFKHIDAMYAVFNWNTIADGGCGKIRGYNSKPTMTGGYGGWLADRGYGTFEHRLWNTPSIPERLWAHVGISIGLQRWAFAIANALPGFTFWDRPARNSYYDSRSAISDTMFTQLSDSVGEIVRGIRSYIPKHDQFTIARDLIVNLTPA